MGKLCGFLREEIINAPPSQRFASIEITNLFPGCFASTTVNDLNDERELAVKLHAF